MGDPNRADQQSPAEVLSTQQVCSRLDISKRTLQNWEKAGIIPRPRRDWRGYRIFSQEDVERIHRVIQEKAQRYRTAGQPAHTAEQSAQAAG